MVAMEELLVGDEHGHVYYYSVEWMSQSQVEIHGWNGHMKLLAKIECHSQQICGLAWSLNGEFFATGANDNACYLFVTDEILKDHTKPSPAKHVAKKPLNFLFEGLTLPNFISRNSTPQPSLPQQSNDTINSRSSFFDLPFPPLASFLRQSTTIIPGRDGSHLISPSHAKHKWMHSAAIKAIAFCPWQRGLIATGGGSNDRAIHFYHVLSGACLATINVHAQVTSLIWSTTRREIAATFGYPQPDHRYRIAVFSWPQCRQVVAIPWEKETRALLGIAYPGGSREAGRSAQRTTMGDLWYDRTREEGCIVVAGSDETVKFHEIWAGESRGMGVGGGGKGALGGSRILEGEEGWEGSGEFVIR